MKKTFESCCRDVCKKNGVKLKWPNEVLPSHIYKQAAELYAKAMVEKATRWISVEERLPETDGDYLVTDGQAIISSNYISKERFWDFWDISFWQHSHVTHWQPLPEPPKTDKP